MKKIAALMSLFLLVMSSCSKSEEYTPPREPKKRPVTIVEKQDNIQQHRNAVNQQQ